MNRKLKLALAALLGFSAACSTVKNAPKQSDNQQTDETVGEVDTLKLRRIIVMYGVRPPQGGPVARPLSETIEAQRVADSLKALKKVHSAGSDVDPVAEKPQD